MLREKCTIEIRKPQFPLEERQKTLNNYNYNKLKKQVKIFWHRAIHESVKPQSIKTLDQNKARNKKINE